MGYKVKHKKCLKSKNTENGKLEYWSAGVLEGLLFRSFFITPLLHYSITPRFLNGKGAPLWCALSYETGFLLKFLCVHSAS
jgi:hypothetical protein